MAARTKSTEIMGKGDGRTSAASAEDIMNLKETTAQGMGTGDERTSATCAEDMLDLKAKTEVMGNAEAKGGGSISADNREVKPAGMVEASSSSTGANARSQQRIVVKKWNSLLFWTWDVETKDVCPICRNRLTEPCSEVCRVSRVGASYGECQARCQVVQGECEHSFHDHCISRWLVRRPVCPIDGLKWTSDELGTSD